MNKEWTLLGIEPTKDTSMIKKAFSEKSKTVHPEENPEGFIELQKAYKFCISYANSKANTIISGTVKIQNKQEQPKLAQKKISFKEEKQDIKNFSQFRNNLNAFSTAPSQIEKTSSINFDTVDENFEERAKQLQQQKKELFFTLRKIFYTKNNYNNSDTLNSFFNSEIFKNAAKSSFLLPDILEFITVNRNSFSSKTKRKIIIPMLNNYKIEWVGTPIASNIDKTINSLQKNLPSATKKQSNKSNFIIGIVLLWVIVLFIFYTIILLQVKKLLVVLTQFS